MGASGPRRTDAAQVVIAGGGVAALEATLAIRELAGERVAIDLLAPEPHCWHRPLAVAEPFGLGLVQRVEVAEVAAAARAHSTLASLTRVEPDRRRVWTSVGMRLEYDALVVACGAIPEPAVPGAVTFRGPADSDRFRRLLDELRAGTVRSVVFVVPRGVVWPMPMYELALLTAAYVEAHAARRVALALVTPEDEPLGAFGREASAAARGLLEERGVAFRGRSEPLAFEGGALATAGGGELAADRAIALPRLRGCEIEGLPHDAQGFLPVDRHGRVPGAEGVYAAGDVTSFHVKQGGLAAQQAAAVAEAVAAAVGAPVTPRPFQPILRGLLLTGGIPRYLFARLAEDGVQAEVSLEPLWWPPTKIAAPRLGPFLAGRATPPLAVEEEDEAMPAAAVPVEVVLDDRPAEPEPELSYAVGALAAGA
jgi:sulfide:quinone oxidoreductase